MTVTSTATKTRGGLLEKLRSIVPDRALMPSEALHVAERQAGMLLSAFGISSPAISHELIAELPFLTVARRAGFPSSGMTTRTDKGWVIVLKSDERAERQRFTLAHELKHLLDDPFIHRLYPRTALYSAHERAERTCDYFAACLLMPKSLLTRDWCAGMQRVEYLARRYRVSRQAMGVRLSQLGLLIDTPRCPAACTEVVL